MPDEPTCDANMKYRSDAFASIHETAEALRDIGAIDKRTMREFDAACLGPNVRSCRSRGTVDLTPETQRHAGPCKTLPCEESGEGAS